MFVIQLNILIIFFKLNCFIGLNVKKIIKIFNSSVNWTFVTGTNTVKRLADQTAEAAAFCFDMIGMVLFSYTNIRSK